MGSPRVSGLGFGVSLLNIGSGMIFLGALGDTIWAKTSPAKRERYSVPVAAGLIAGEALVAVVIPILVTFGLMQLPS